MNRSRVHMLGAVLFIIGALLFISAVAIIAIGDYAIASSMTDMGEFTELSSSMDSGRCFQKVNSLHLFWSLWALGHMVIW